jgi:hypothetical protein
VEAFDIIHAARSEGVTNPDIYVARLKAMPGMSTERARELLALEGIETDGLVDARLTTVGDTPSPRGFAPR